MNPEIGVWQPNYFYLKDKQVRSPAGAFEHAGRAQLQCAQSHKSGATFDATEKALWTRLDPDNSGTYVPRDQIVINAADHASVQAACDLASARATGAVPLGVTVQLPPGITTLTTTLLIKQQSFTLKGSGPGSVLKWGGSAGLPMIDVQDSSRVEITDMTIIGDNTNTPSHGIYFEAPTSPTVGTNEWLFVRRVAFGRRYTQEPSPNGKMTNGLVVGGSFNGSNDQFTVEDCQFRDCVTYGFSVPNSQSIWGQVKNCIFDTCGTGMNVGANIQCHNIQFNRNVVLDLNLTQGRCQIYGLFAENTPQIWAQGFNSYLSIKGGKAVVGPSLLGANWAKSNIAGNAGSGLRLEDMLVTRSTGTANILIAGSSSAVTPASVFMRGNNLPDGETDAGYEINGYGAGNPISVDIQQNAYWRKQVVQSLNPAGTVVLPNTALPADVQRFTSTGTWTKPAGASLVHIRVWGGGAGGGSGAREPSGTLATGGAGGGGGGYTDRWIKAADIAATVTVTVSTGGAGGASIGTDATVGNAGGAGGFSSFGAAATYWCQANGGGAGAGGTAAGAAAGGIAGGGANGSGTAGGASSATGGVGTAGTAPTGGAAGGGGAGGGVTTGAATSAGGNGGNVTGGPTTAAGGAAGVSGGAATSFPLALSGGAASGGGGGGSSTSGAAGSGGAGGFPGGGGGGGGSATNGNATGAGGAGGTGLVIVETYF